MAGLRLLFDNFESASQKRVNSIGKENDDPTIYLGTGGITYALFRAVTALDVSHAEVQPNQIGSTEAQASQECPEEEVKLAIDAQDD